ncbi:hypothetical protein GCM10025779_09570 [Arthrobacter cryoconiti]
MLSTRGGAEGTELDEGTERDEGTLLGVGVELGAGAGVSVEAGVGVELGAGAGVVVGEIILLPFMDIPSPVLAGQVQRVFSQPDPLS